MAYRRVGRRTMNPPLLQGGLAQTCARIYQLTRARLWPGCRAAADCTGETALPVRTRSTTVRSDGTACLRPHDRFRARNGYSPIRPDRGDPVAGDRCLQ